MTPMITSSQKNSFAIYYDECLVNYHGNMKNSTLDDAQRLVDSIIFDADGIKG
jgi:hypothetical protein